MKYPQILDKLKQKYQSREVSALVGAGFSKNISGEYPSWQQLLYDMVIWLYEYEIEQSYLNYIHCKGTSELEVDEISFKKDFANKIIHREGYLEIVSQFIKKKGFREAIEVYIEERIPSVRHDKRDLFFLKENKSIPLNSRGIDLFNILLDGFWDNIFTTNYDHLLEYINKLSDKQWKNTITNDYQLTSGNNKSIIKIHGHLRTEEDNLFEFDNDFSIRYIISKEDYEEYPIKHEAFTQLMRISLLKGIFCLFGFSGDDPNFLAWVKWVRDIIVKNPNERVYDKDDFKIFLISLDEVSPSGDKLQFYRNHRIVVIPLKNPDVKSIIGVGIDEKDPIILFKGFFNYLYSTKEEQNILIEKKSYSSLWTTVSKSERVLPSNGNFEFKITLNTPILEKIIEDKSHNRFVKNIYSQSEYLSYSLRYSSLSVDKAKLAIIALEDTLYPLSWYPEISENILSYIGNLESWNIRLLKLKEREESLNIRHIKKSQNNSPIYFENILRAAFTLKFKELQALLDEWSTNNEDVQKCAGFYSIMDINKATSILSSYIEKEIDEKEKNYAQQQLNYLSGRDISYDNNEHNILDYRDTIINNMSRPKPIKPYGNTGSQDNDSKSLYRNSFRLLQFLIETGWQNSRNGLTFITSETLYEAFTNLFEDYPYPVLYYMLQYGGNKDVLKRLGQDFAYSSTLQEENIYILEMLFTAYFSDSTPKTYKRNILWICSELLISVPPIHWRKHFLQIWEKEVLDNWEEMWHTDALEAFIINGLPYLDFTCSKQIIIDCLQNRDKKSDTSIKYLYHNHDSLKKNLTKLKKDTELKLTISSFINNIKEGTDFVIAGNIFNLLTQEELKIISQKINIINAQSELKPFVLRSMSFFAKQDPKICKVYKDVILNSPYLWHNGLRKDSVTDTNFINIDQISYNIKWNKSELLKIYDSLCQSSEQLKSRNIFEKDRTRMFFNSHVSLLYEMCLFLGKNEKTLEIKANFHQIKTELNNYYIEKRGFNILDEALISDDYSITKDGAFLLTKEIELWGWEKQEPAFNLLLNRVIFKNNNAFIYCLSVIVYLLQNYPQEDIIDKYISQLSLIIQIYRDDHIIFEMKQNKAEVFYYMIKIADFLEKKGIESENVTFWLELRKSKRFNNLSSPM